MPINTAPYHAQMHNRHSS